MDLVSVPLLPKYFPNTLLSQLLSSYFDLRNILWPPFFQNFKLLFHLFCCLPHVSALFQKLCLFFFIEGNVLKARDILANLDNAVPGLVHVKLCRVNFERRCNDFQNACAIYEQAIAECSDTQLISFYSVKYSRFLTKVICNISFFFKKT